MKSKLPLISFPATIVTMITGISIKEAVDLIFGTGKYAGERNIWHLPQVGLPGIQMPGMNWKEVLERIKADLQTGSLPAIILTSSKKHPGIKKYYVPGAGK